MASILLVDDKESILTVMGAMLRREGFEIRTASSGEEALASALAEEPDAVVSDVRMGGMSGPALLRELRARGLDLPFVLVTAYAEVPEAVSAMRDGALHYLPKPVDYPELVRTLRHSIARAAARSPEGRSALRRIVGAGPAMRRLLTRVEAVAGSEATVLIRGENGTGKELVARAIHRAGGRRTGPFVAVHCAALNPNLLESELFGHEAGAFTGAARRKDGYLEAARGGVLFLDEISEVPLDTQVKLLRSLQERAYVRVGGTELVACDFRLVAATNKDLEAEVAAGRFRSDLYYRLDVVPLRIPPLRERSEDLPELVAHFSARAAAAEGLDAPVADPSFIDALSSYGWPGNVRELENLIERLIVLYKPRRLGAELLMLEAPERFGAPGVAGPSAESPAAAPVQDDERAATMEALRRSGGNRTKAAQLLGISRRTLYYRLERLGKIETSVQ